MPPDEKSGMRQPAQGPSPSAGKRRLSHETVFASASGTEKRALSGKTALNRPSRYRARPAMKNTSTAPAGTEQGPPFAFFSFFAFSAPLPNRFLRAKRPSHCAVRQPEPFSGKNACRYPRPANPLPKRPSGREHPMPGTPPCNPAHKKCISPIAIEKANVYHKIHAKTA